MGHTWTGLYSRNQFLDAIGWPFVISAIIPVNFWGCPLTDRELGQALASDFGDVEDALQHFVCVRERIGTIVTRNVSDFRPSDRAIVTPRELLRSLGPGK